MTIAVVKLGISINSDKVFESIKAYHPHAGFQNLVTEAMALAGEGWGLRDLGAHALPSFLHGVLTF